MKIAFISANCGGFDKDIQHFHAAQDVAVDFFYFTKDGPNPRLLAKKPKMLGWELYPGYDIYVWADAVITFSRGNAVEWLLKQLGDADIAFFAHQDGRTGIQEELAYMYWHMSGKSEAADLKDYLNSRYAGQPTLEQAHHYLSDPAFVDDHLYSAGLFIYRNNDRTRKMLRAWHDENVLWTVQDQISLPYVLSKSECSVAVINEQIYENDYTDYFWRYDSNAHKWDDVYVSLPTEPSAFWYGDTASYRKGAEFLADCKTVEDWGTGAGGFKRFRPDAVGVDGSATPHADKIVNLEEYRSNCEGIFLRHVLEHNRNWKVILKNALASATKKVVVVLFIPLNKGRTQEWFPSTAENVRHGINTRSLSISEIDFFNIIVHGGVCGAVAEQFKSATAYGEETIVLITKSS